ncbi:hypothetical protein ABT337_12780 [Saccharopolyspora hirsuta]|uniref:DUF3558 domain-containing protein n=1 Tax=Saccharopolyspora hirsuta TaxID=1837 RepID=A0A5M7BTK7_SACHI|nr:hypothetical protein [Saccharopolyspora hirsuta]KAA5832733.1 hypothetical protein F1721_17300 [Saccharopolyspora hirsuta]
MFRPVPLIAALLSALAAAGCAASPGIEPTVSERRTVDLPDVPVDQPGALLDPAFAPERLRGVDVCGTLRATGLEQYGRPNPEFSPSGLGTCSNYMKDHDGEDFNATLYFDYGVQDPSRHRIGGLPAQISESSGTCFASAAHTGADLKAFGVARGLAIQLSGSQTDICSPAVQMLTDAIDVVRTAPPVNARTSGGLAGFDPCQIADPAVLRDALAGGAPDDEGGRGLYECSWVAENGVAAKVKFELGQMERTDVPPGTPPPPPIDLGGAPTTVQVRTDPPACAVEWQHRRTATGTEFVHVEISNLRRIPMDPCVSAANLARQVRAKLPAA